MRSITILKLFALSVFASPLFGMPPIDPAALVSSPKFTYYPTQLIDASIVRTPQGTKVYGTLQFNSACAELAVNYAVQKSLPINVEIKTVQIIENSIACIEILPGPQKFLLLDIPQSVGSVSIDGQTIYEIMPFPVK